MSDAPIPAEFERPRRLDPFETIFQVAWTTLRRSVRGLRIFWTIAVVAFPALLSYGIARDLDHKEQEQFFYGILSFYHFGIAVPVVGLILATAFPWPESDEGTLTYWFTAPVRRWAVYLGRYIAAVALGVMILPLSVLAAGLPLDLPPEVGLPGAMRAAITATLLAYPAYVGLFGLSAVVIRKTLVVGVVFVLIENSMALFSGTIARLTIVYYVRSLIWPAASRIGQRTLQDAAQIKDPASATAAVTVFLAVAILTVALALPLIHAIEYRGKHAQPA